MWLQKILDPGGCKTFISYSKPICHSYNINFNSSIQYFHKMYKIVSTDPISDVAIPYQAMYIIIVHSICKYHFPAPWNNDMEKSPTQRFFKHVENLLILWSHFWTLFGFYLKLGHLPFLFCMFLCWRWISRRLVWAKQKLKLKLMILW